MAGQKLSRSLLDHAPVWGILAPETCLYCSVDRLLAQRSLKNCDKTRRIAQQLYSTGGKLAREAFNTSSDQRLRIQQ
jgi:hypothetical protein